MRAELDHRPLPPRRRAAEADGGPQVAHRPVAAIAFGDEPANLVALELLRARHAVLAGDAEAPHPHAGLTERDPHQVAAAVERAALQGDQAAERGQEAG